jgi:hypothetical protein
MSDTLLGVLIGGAIGVVTTFITLIGTLGAQRVRHRHERELVVDAGIREDRERKVSRLRDLYAGVLEFALSYPESQLGYQLQTMKPEDEAERTARLAALAGRVNAVRARLTIEPDPRANHDVLMALISVVGASDMYGEAARWHRANPGAESHAEMGRKQRLLSDEFGKLEQRCRDHIAAVDAAEAPAPSV